MSSKKPIPRAEAEARLRETGRRDLLETLQRLPDDVDPRLAADAAVSLVRGESSWLFARKAQVLPLAVIEAVLAQLEATHPRVAWSVFLREVVPPVSVPSWRAALVALLDLQTTYAWGAKQRRAKLQGLATQPALLAGIQAAVVGCDAPPLDMLAVLALDGSDTSIDALLPHFSRAEKDQSAMLDRLERLSKYAAPTPGMQAMLATVRARLDARNDASPVLDWVRGLGFEVDTFSLRVSFGSEEATSRVPRIQASVNIDSTRATWLGVYVTESSLQPPYPGTSFRNDGVARDDLGLGTCTLAELPQWLARAQRTLGVTWSPRVTASASVRGNKRAQLIDWMFGPSR